MDRLSSPKFSFRGFFKHKENFIFNPDYFKPTMNDVKRGIDLDFYHHSEFLNYPAGSAIAGYNLADELRRRSSYIDLKIKNASFFKGGLNLVWYILPSVEKKYDDELIAKGYTRINDGKVINAQGFIPELLDSGTLLPRNGIARTKFANCAVNYTHIANSSDFVSDRCELINNSTRVEGCIFQSDNGVCDACDTAGGYFKFLTPQKDGPPVNKTTLFMDIPNRKGEPPYNPPIPCTKLGVREPLRDIDGNIISGAIFNNYTMGENECMNDKPIPGYNNTDLR